MFSIFKIDQDIHCLDHQNNPGSQRNPQKCHFPALKNAMSFNVPYGIYIIFLEFYWLDLSRKILRCMWMQHRVEMMELCLRQNLKISACKLL